MWYYPTIKINELLIHGRTWMNNYAGQWLPWDGWNGIQRVKHEVVVYIICDSRLTNVTHVKIYHIL